MVWDTVSRLLSQPQLIIDQVKKGEHKPLGHLETNLDRVGHALARKKIEADRMLDAYKIGAVDLHTLKQKMDKIRSEEAELNDERLRLETELDKAEAQELNEQKLLEFCRNLPNTLASLAFADRRQVLREVMDKIVVDGDEVTIYGIIPVPDEKVEDASIELHSPYQGKGVYM